MNKNNLFIPLVGEKFDGHDFIDKAFSEGAALTLTDNEAFAHGKPCIVVIDTLIALQDIAKCYKERYDIPFVAENWELPI